MSVKVVHWNPRRAVLPGPLQRVSHVGARTDNFGDLLGPLIVDRLVTDRGLTGRRGRTRRLVTVGSIMKLTRPGDVVWGTGVNGKSLSRGAAPRLDVRAVRGPLTRAALLEEGTAVPEVFGDPGLLWGRLWTREATLSAAGMPAGGGVVVVPNLHDWATHRDDPRAVNPRQDPHDVAARIAGADLVVASSLHGLVIAESFGIPAQLLAPRAEPAFKYDDYYRGTGRSTFRAAATIDEAVAWGGEAPPVFDADALVAAFPWDLWSDA